MFSLIASMLLTPLVLAAEATENSEQKIQLLSNRFRVDQAVEKIVFIIDRIPQSAPVILIQPDGSKLYSNKRQKNVKWMDGNAGDMIEIVNPQIGPWQIIGNILPSSEIRLATSLQLQVEPIPPSLFIGEEIKLTSSLVFNNRLLKIGQVDDLIKHEVYLRSRNEEGQDNFGAGTFIIGDFVDDGYGLDEKSGDGVFTGRLDLNKPMGNYDLLVRVSNKVFEREYKQVLLLRALPIAVDLLSAAIGDQYTLRFIINDKIVDPNSMMLQIKVTDPNSTIKHHSINGMAAIHLFRLPEIEEMGRYKINIDVFGKTVAGRDFKFSLKQIKVRLSVLPKAVAKKALAKFDSERETAFEKKLKRKALAEKRQHKKENRTLVFIAIMVNVIILLVGALLLWLFFRTKKPKLSKEEKAKLKEEQVKAKADKAQAKKDKKADKK